MAKPQDQQRQGDEPRQKVDVTFYVNKLRRATDFQFIFGILGIILMLVQLELCWHYNTSGFFPLCRSTDPEWCDPRMQAQIFPIRNGQLVVNIVRGLISATTVVSLFYGFRYYSALWELRKLRNLAPQKASLWGSGQLVWEFLLETAFLLVHSFPGIDNIDDKHPSFLIAMNLGMFCRIVLFTRVLRYHSPLNTSNGRFIGSLTNVDFSTSFIVKTTLKDSPVKFVTLTFLTLILVSSYSLHIVDSYMCATYESMKCEPVSFFDSCWLLIITILTVGYGDVVPASSGGRVITVLGGLIGTLLTAVTIALTTSYLKLSRSEHKVVTFLKKDSNRRVIRRQAVICIQRAYRYYLSKHSKFKYHNVGTYESALFQSLSRFRELKRYVLSHDGTDATDKQITVLETMEVNIDDLRSKLEILETSLLEERKEVDATVPENSALPFGIPEGKDTRKGFPGNKEPGWVKSVGHVINESTSKIEVLQAEVLKLSETITRHIANTNSRLEKLERRGKKE